MNLAEPIPIDQATATLLLAAAGDPLSVSTSGKVIVAAWSDLAQQLVEGDVRRFDAWRHSVLELARAAEPETAEKSLGVVALLIAVRARRGEP